MDKGKRTVRCACGVVFHNITKMHRHMAHYAHRPNQHAPNMEHENTAKSVKRYKKAHGKEK